MDGIAVRAPFPEALADLVGLVGDILLVEDHTLVEAVRYTHRAIGPVLEPSGGRPDLP